MAIVDLPMKDGLPCYKLMKEGVEVDVCCESITEDGADKVGLRIVGEETRLDRLIIEAFETP